MTSTHERAAVHLEACRFDEAEAEARKALLEAEHHNDIAQIADVLCTIACIRSASGEPRSAARAYRRALLFLANRKVDEETISVRCAALRGLGHLHRSRAEYDEAEPFFRRALGLAQRLGPSHLELQRSLADLGMLYRYTGRFDEAIRLYRHALQIARRAGHEGLDGLHHKLAGAEYMRGRLASAERHGREALARTAARLGRTHPVFAMRMGVLAPILYARSKHDEAERLLERTIAIFRRTFGDEHYEIAVSLHNLGSVRYATGDRRRAEALYRESLAMKTKVLGARHPDVALTLNNLSVVIAARGDVREAKRFGREALRIVDRVYGPAHPETRLLRRNLDCLAGR